MAQLGGGGAVQKLLNGFKSGSVKYVEKKKYSYKLLQVCNTFDGC